MYFTECARLAEQNPNLGTTIEKVDDLLKQSGTAEAIRVDVWARILQIDPNQIATVLDRLAKAEFLVAEEMVECAHCSMQRRRADYQREVDEIGECPCSSCERPLEDGTSRFITTYRRGEKWKETPAIQAEKPADTTPSPIPVIND